MGEGKKGAYKAVVFNLFKVYLHGDHKTLNLFLDLFMGHEPQVENICEQYCKDG